MKLYLIIKKIIEDLTGQIMRTAAYIISLMRIHIHNKVSVRHYRHLVFVAFVGAWWEFLINPTRCMHHLFVLVPIIGFTLAYSLSMQMRSAVNRIPLWLITISHICDIAWYSLFSRLIWCTKTDLSTAAMTAFPWISSNIFCAALYPVPYALAEKNGELAIATD